MIIVPGIHVKIFAEINASSRTKNRLIERGKSGFTVKQVSESVSALGNRPAILVMSISDMDAGREPWIGWLPRDEIDVTWWEV